jgi:hypothetical protein
MKKTPSRKSQTERRKSPRRSPQASKEASPEAVQQATTQEACAYCAKPLAVGDRALYVEEEVGRSFCAEECITRFFAPEVERLEADYQRRVVSGDILPEQREELQHLRWATLKEPDEVWREKTLSGDHRYTLIAQFENGLWCICLSLFLKGEPSFLFLCVVSRNAALVESYRRGERMSWVKRRGAERSVDQSMPEFTQAQQALDGTVIPGVDQDLMEAAGFTQAPADGLALDGWSTEESLRATVNGERSPDDIQPSEFGVYQNCLEETLQEPSELWSLEAVSDEEEVRLYHFIKHYPESEGQGFWYVIVAREVVGNETEEDHLEVLDAFPSKDPERVSRYRQGNQEMEAESIEPAQTARVLH